KAFSRITRVNLWLLGVILFAETVECILEKQIIKQGEKRWNENQLAALLPYCEKQMALRRRI
ncbi:MAG: hypothetical protein RSC96_06940, partial [Oscillospiraceae bacterium]